MPGLIEDRISTDLLSAEYVFLSRYDMLVKTGVCEKGKEIEVPYHKRAATERKPSLAAAMRKTHVKYRPYHCGDRAQLHGIIAHGFEASAAAAGLQAPRTRPAQHLTKRGTTERDARHSQRSAPARSA